MEREGLSNIQMEMVLQFQDFTGIEDITVCRDVLTRHMWDLEVAIQEQLNIREGRPSVYATESRPPQVINDRYLQHVFSSSSSSNRPPSGWKGVFTYVINNMFSFCYNTLSSLIMAFLNLFKSNERIVTDPLRDVLTFIDAYKEKYPVHPVFYHGTYAQALNDAKRELKFLLVYLHSEGKSDADSFCRNALSDAQVVAYINRNMLFWACDIAAPEGYRVSHSINARTYPILVVVGMRWNKMIIMGRMEGDCTAEELLRRLQTVVTDNEVYLSQARAERLERSLTQTLRKQQDEAYEQSLKADQEKERRKQEEKEEQLKREQAIEAEKQAEVERKNNIARLKIEMASEVPSEPPADAAETTSVVFKLPSGARIERRFFRTDSIRDVYNFIFCHPASPDHFEITTNFPKRILYSEAKEIDADGTIADAKLQNREVLFVNDLDA
ncbi:FAS-associated factor 2 [Phlebotomus argentipes]|uniref:FAS-associated factor 2 n=1 Tax=Phlebotomus argentipes TaxID=94469 RepID=UPI002892D702|nr:FAS-associated factor 2 [Phlebotomus argentipes]